MAIDRGFLSTRPAIAVGVVTLAVLLVGWFVWWTKPPQMGADAGVFASVDALFTAVTARDEKLLAQCEQRLHSLKAAGKCPIEASDYLDDIIHKSRAGRWESAAERLYEFMRAQRRDGSREVSHKTEKNHPRSTRK
jgi:hypothetical protein